MSTPFLTAEWRYLVMLSYEIDPDVLGPHVPDGTSLDRWQERALVSVVGFRFLDTRVLGVAVPLHRHFDEVNLRFYVRRAGPEGTRRGVVFLRELVPRAAVTTLARLAYHEPYRTAPMRSRVPRVPLETPGRLAYGWRLGGAWHRLAATTAGAPAVPAPGSAAAFVTERHWGYSRRRDGATAEYRVAHPPWRTWAAADPVLAGDTRLLHGPALGEALSRPPASAVIAEGSAVAVEPPRRLPRGGC